MRAEVRTKLISRKHVKAFALAVASNRAHKFTRVGGEFFIRCEANLIEFIRTCVGALPSKGNEYAFTVRPLLPRAAEMTEFATPARAMISAKHREREPAE